jgi:8-oxo-dGTP diphosphatase
MRKSVHVVAAYVERDDKVLLDRRAEGTHLAGTWEFPGGKVEANEDEVSALARELREELGVEARIGNEIARVHHAYPEFDLQLALFEVYLDGEPQAVGVAEIGWFDRRRLREIDMPPADRPLIEAIERSFDDTVA